jgi:hypothetical protein
MSIDIKVHWFGEKAWLPHRGTGEDSFSHTPHFRPGTLLPPDVPSLFVVLCNEAPASDPDH